MKTTFRFASVLLPVLLATSCGGDDDGGSHDEPEPDIDAGEQDPDDIDGGQDQQSPCELIGNDLSPSAQASPIDGVYTPQESFGNGVRQTCSVSDENTSYTYYLSIDHGIASKYARHFPEDGFACLQAGFDEGGEIIGPSETTWRTCGPVVSIDGGEVQQAVELHEAEDGTISRWYFYFGTGERSDEWDEILVGTLSSSDPIDESPAELNFIRYRRPR